MNLLISGSSGLIGSAAVEFFDGKGHTIHGVDNNQRMEFFGPAGDTRPNLARVYHNAKDFHHYDTSISDYAALEKYVFSNAPFDAVIHCAAQPSHDFSREEPMIDFRVNALGTANLLELTRLTSPKAVFLFMSTNKVYGDLPNKERHHNDSMLGFNLTDVGKRLDFIADYAEDSFQGFTESLSIDQSTHSVFGANKAGADLLVQEYGRYFGLKTVVFRGGCLTGPAHAGVPLHGFLSYLVKCAVEAKPYTIIGHKGKQVRDNIHSYDVILAFEEVIKHPPSPGTVFNLGGGRENSTSILESIEWLESFLGRKMIIQHEDTPRVGDHVCYITDMSKFKSHYPDWGITKSLDQTMMEIVGACNLGRTTERYVPGDGGDNYFERYAAPIIERCYGTVLDIGCGHGFLTQRIAAIPAVKSVKGTDMISGYRPHHPKASYWHISTETLRDVLVDDYDCIVSTEHLEHLDDGAQTNLLRWISHHLLKEGLFLGSMPLPDDPENPNPWHKQTYTPKRWLEILYMYFPYAEIYEIEGGYWWVASNSSPKEEAN